MLPAEDVSQPMLPLLSLDASQGDFTPMLRRCGVVGQRVLGGRGEQGPVCTLRYMHGRCPLLPGHAILVYWACGTKLILPPTRVTRGHARVGCPSLVEVVGLSARARLRPLQLPRLVHCREECPLKHTTGKRTVDARARVCWTKVFFYIKTPNRILANRFKGMLNREVSGIKIKDKDLVVRVQVPEKNRPASRAMGSLRLLILHVTQH